MLMSAVPMSAQIAAREFRIDARTVIPRAGPQGATPAVSIATPGRAQQARGMVSSWSLDRSVRFGLGRYEVLPIARPRSNLERERLPMERHTGSIAGAGVRLAF